MANRKKIRDTKARTRRARAQGEGLKVRDPRTADLRDIAPYRGVDNIPLASSRYHRGMEQADRGGYNVNALRYPEALTNERGGSGQNLFQAITGHPGAMQHVQGKGGLIGRHHPVSVSERTERALSHRNPDMPRLSAAQMAEYSQDPDYMEMQRLQQDREKKHRRNRNLRARKNP